MTDISPPLFFPFPFFRSFPRLRAYAQLVRLPNLFTALADICLGTLGATALMAAARIEWFPFTCLLAASACLYSGGMAWNDYFDMEEDRRERPARPLPSGRLKRREAKRLGTSLLALGCICAFLAGWTSAGFCWSPLLLAGLLVLVILLYDAWLKRTWAGPFGMGLCRFLNVLLGFSALLVADWRSIYLASIVGIYIVGVTWFARTEARRSKPASLKKATSVMLAGLVLAVPAPMLVPPGASSPLFPYLLVGLGFWVGIPVCRAVGQPIPARVQAAVKRSIFGLIVLDAVLASALIGNAGLGILFLLVPALVLGRWVYST